MTFSFTSVFPLATKKHSLLITQFWKQTSLLFLSLKHKEETNSLELHCCQNEQFFIHKSASIKF